MRRKLARHLANNACENAMKRLYNLKEDISELKFDIGEVLQNCDKEDQAERNR